MTKTKQTIIEINAEYIFFIVVGKKNNLKKFAKQIILNKSTYTDNNIKYILTRLSIPIINNYDKIKKKYSVTKIDSCVESAQAFSYAQEQFIFPENTKKYKHTDLSDSYMLMEVNNNILTFPKIYLTDGDPEKLIYDWIEKKCGKIPFHAKIKKTLKPLSLVGYNSDILVYTTNI